MSKVKQGDFGYPATNDLIKLDNGGYLISYQSGTEIYVSELNADLNPIKSPILVTPSHLTSTTFSDPFLYLMELTLIQVVLDIIFPGASWDNTIYKAVMPIGSDYHHSFFLSASVSKFCQPPPEAMLKMMCRRSKRFVWRNYSVQFG